MLNGGTPPWAAPAAAHPHQTRAAARPAGRADGTACRCTLHCTCHPAGWRRCLQARRWRRQVCGGGSGGGRGWAAAAAAAGASEAGASALMAPTTPHTNELHGGVRHCCWGTIGGAAGQAAPGKVDRSTQSLGAPRDHVMNWRGIELGAGSSSGGAIAPLHHLSPMAAITANAACESHRRAEIPRGTHERPLNTGQRLSAAPSSSPLPTAHIQRVF